MSGFTDVLKTLAPTIATVLGGPLAGMAVEALGSALGVSDATQEKVLSIFESGRMTSDQVAQVKVAELALVAKLKELDIDLERIHAGDRASARVMQSSVKSTLPGFLAILITAGFFGILVGMLTGDLKTANSEALLIMLGALAAAWGGVVNFYYGSSRGSEEKNALMGKR